jgi:hypothetical protein
MIAPQRAMLIRIRTIVADDGLSSAPISDSVCRLPCNMDAKADYTTILVCLCKVHRIVNY